MKQYQVLNVKCNGCASTLKSKLKPMYGQIEVDLNVDPRIITINQDEEILRKQLITLGYPIADENMSTLQSFSTTAKSFVSCAIGKVKNEG
jgi:copper chaperone CopZ